MQIIDDFFEQSQYSILQDLVYHEITQHHRESKETQHGEESVDLGLDNSRFYMLEGDCKRLLLDAFVKNGFLKESVLDNVHECYLRYHECKHPYQSLWHRDRIGNEIDYVGFVLYLDNQWKTEYGGLFLYKSAFDDSQGVFVEPKPNRLVVNDRDDWHSVTMIVDPDVVRKSMNFFIPYKYQQS
jgi:hypothetical protein